MIHILSLAFLTVHRAGRALSRRFIVLRVAQKEKKKEEEDAKEQKINEELTMMYGNERIKSEGNILICEK